MFKRVGLVVARLQPLHKGHTKIINHMIQECETAIICLGSAQKSREQHDPWTVEERMAMLRNVYADRIKIVPLNDLGATRPEQWVNYIFEKLKKLGMKEPTDYYTGSEQDSFWYRDHFAVNWHELEEKSFDYEDIEHQIYIANKYKIENKDASLSGASQFRRLHILDRNINSVPSATELRGFLELRNDGWKEWTPNVNHKTIEDNYPEEFKVPLK